MEQPIACFFYLQAYDASYHPLPWALLIIRQHKMISVPSNSGSTYHYKKGLNILLQVHIRCAKTINSCCAAIKRAKTQEEWSLSYTHTLKQYVDSCDFSGLTMWQVSESKVVLLSFDFRWARAGQFLYRRGPTLETEDNTWKMT